MSTLTFTSQADRLAFAARVQEEATKNRSYEATPIGQAVKDYLDEGRLQQLEAMTIYNRELILSKLALFYAHKQLEEISGAAGHRLLMRFIEHHWPGSGSAARSSRVAYVNYLRGFFKWAEYLDLVDKDPTRNIRLPRVQERDADLYSPDEREALIASQPRLRDRVALLVLFDLALRCAELRAIRFKHMRLGENRIVIFGKGGTVREMPFRWERTRLALERYILELGLSARELGEGAGDFTSPGASTDAQKGRIVTGGAQAPSPNSRPNPDEYLLHPERVVRRGSWPEYRYERYDDPKLRFKPYEPTSFYGWWEKVHEAAGVRYRRPHEVRHTGIDEVVREYGIRKGQLFARHASIGTTQRYSHETASELEELFRDAERREPFLPQPTVAPPSPHRKYPPAESHGEL